MLRKAHHHTQGWYYQTVDCGLSAYKFSMRLKIMSFFWPGQWKRLIRC